MSQCGELGPPPSRRAPADTDGRRGESVRWTRIRDIKAAIDAGTYLTSERLDAAVEGMLRDLEA
ncbi:MAG: hypothetical protein QF733_07670 [Phycisphaerales bacterium]|nr:hypothetical protein [Phycisphaerales bacterium]